MRPPRESYIRASGQVRGYTIEPGVEFRAGDEFDRMTADLSLMFRSLQNALIAASQSAMGTLDSLVRPRIEGVAEIAESLIVERWPDRAYFIEVHDRDGWLQIFQPYGLPRNP